MRIYNLIFLTILVIVTVSPINILGQNENFTNITKESITKHTLGICTKHKFKKLSEFEKNLNTSKIEITENEKAKNEFKELESDEKDIRKKHEEEETKIKNELDQTSKKVINITASILKLNGEEINLRNSINSNIKKIQKERKYQNKIKSKIELTLKSQNNEIEKQTLQIPIFAYCNFVSPQSYGAIEIYEVTSKISINEFINDCSKLEFLEKNNILPTSITEYMKESPLHISVDYDWNINRSFPSINRKNHSERRILYILKIKFSRDRKFQKFDLPTDEKIKYVFCGNDASIIQDKYNEETKKSILSRLDTIKRKNKLMIEATNFVGKLNELKNLKKLLSDSKKRTDSLQSKNKELNTSLRKIILTLKDKNSTLRFNENHESKLKQTKIATKDYKDIIFINDTKFIHKELPRKKFLITNIKNTLIREIKRSKENFVRGIDNKNILVWYKIYKELTPNKEYFIYSIYYSFRICSQNNRLIFYKDEYILDLDKKTQFPNNKTIDYYYYTKYRLKLLDNDYLATTIKKTRDRKKEYGYCLGYLYKKKNYLTSKDGSVLYYYCGNLLCIANRYLTLISKKRSSAAKKVLFRYYQYAKNRYLLSRKILFILNLIYPNYKNVKRLEKRNQRLKLDLQKIKRVFTEI